MRRPLQDVSIITREGSLAASGAGRQVPNERVEGPLQNIPITRQRSPASSSSGRQIPDDTLEALARSFFKDAFSYGFTQLDYVQFVNSLLDLSIHEARSIAAANNGMNSKAATPWYRPDDAEAARLPIENEHIVIRAFDVGDDLRLLSDWLKDDFGRYFILSCSTARTVDCKGLVRSPSSHFGMITLKDGMPVGTVAYVNHDPVQRRAEVRKLIGIPALRGKGLGKEAARLWMRYGVAGLGLRKIYLQTLDTHLHNIRLNEDLGFKVEGVLRDEILLDGRYRDVLRMAFRVDGRGSRVSS